MSGSKKTRRGPASAGLLMLLAASWISAAGSGATPPDFTGVWLIEKAPMELRQADGSAAPLTAWGKEIYAKNQSKLRKKDVSFDLTRQRCASPGAVRMMTFPYAVEIFQRPFQLTLLFEWNHLYRMINLREQPKVAPYPLAIGTSNGRWEGDTLVVETTDLTENTQLDSSGLPHSDQLKVVERIRLLDGDHLEDVITLHDPKTFSRDWSVNLTYKKTGAKGLNEDVCLDRLESGQPAVAELH